MIVGVLELASKYKYGLTSRGAPLYLFKPYDHEQPDYVVGCSHRDTSTNQIAIIESSHHETGQKPRGLLNRLIGPVGNFHAEKEALLLHYNPSKDRRQDPIPSPLTRYDDGRVEISAETGWTVFHVDPAGCRDVDDALAFHPETGRWAITIADVAAAVPEGCEVDCTAALLGTSFYDLEGRVLTPMLPPAISEGSSSLLPGSRKRGLTLFMEMDEPYFATSWITVGKTYTYESVVGTLIASKLEAAFGPGVASDPHKWIETAMIFYNAAAAQLLLSPENRSRQGLLRVQANRPEMESSCSELAHLLREAASYEPVTTTLSFKGHASLGLSAYCHASSPLRRYADLVTQRAIHAILTPASTVSFADVLPIKIKSTHLDIATHLNERTKAARRFGRDLTFLTHVTPGKVHEINVVVVDPAEKTAFVPLWSRIIRLRHDLDPADAIIGKEIRIQIYCDSTQRNWKQRVLTAATS